MGRRRRKKAGPFGAVLQRARETAGVGVVEMAERLNVSRQQVWRIENSDNLREETMRGYAEALGLTPSLSLA